jgi:hypothetical protein
MLTVTTGAIDGCHIPIKAPENSYGDYLNRKGWHSLILQGVCDYKHVFTDLRRTNSQLFCTRQKIPTNKYQWQPAFSHQLGLEQNSHLADLNR